MKKYTYTVNNGVQKGTYTVEAASKKEAIEKAKKAHPLGGVNTSSFKLAK